jgi:hypothetical protein
MAAHDDNEIASLNARLNELEAERSALSERLERLHSRVGTGAVGEPKFRKVGLCSCMRERVGAWRLR